MSHPEMPPALVAAADQYHASGAEAIQALLAVYRGTAAACGLDLAAEALAGALEADPTYTRHILANAVAHALRHIDRHG